MPKVKDERKVDAIKKALLTLIVKDGYKGIKMAEVARVAGVATGTVYVYFKDKDTLINETYINTKKRISQSILQATSEQDNFYNNFEKMWFNYVHFCINRPEEMLFVDQFLYSGILSENTIEEGELFMEPIFNFLRYGQESGFVREGDEKVLMAQLMGAIHAIVKESLKMDKTWIRQQLDLCFEMAWSAIRC